MSINQNSEFPKIWGMDIQTNQVFDDYKSTPIYLSLEKFKILIFSLLYFC